MSDNVTMLSKPNLLLWVCECGCSTFSLFSDGTTECAACYGWTPEEGGGWLEDTKNKGALPDDVQTFTDVSGNGSVEFARRRLASIAQQPDAKMLIVAREDGSIHAWADIVDQTSNEWAMEKIEKARDLISAAYGTKHE